jgi:hypothetical protein
MLNIYIHTYIESTTLLTHVLHSVSQASSAVFAVHVVGATAGVVTDPDAKVLDGTSLLFENFVHRQDLTSGLLHLLVLVQEIPKSRASSHLVRGEDLHAVQFRSRVELGRLLAPDDVEVLDSL